MSVLTALIVCNQATGQETERPKQETVAASTAPREVVVTAARSSRQSVEAAIIAFKAGDTTAALEQIDEALSLSPSNLELVEFRGLILFARGDYHQASVAIHQVMEFRPGWTWPHVHRLYPGVELYTRHLRTLEEFTRKHPDDGAARFLQAYHYKVGGFPQAAVRELEMVVRLEVHDPVAVNLMKRLSQRSGGALTPNSPTGRY